MTGDDEVHPLAMILQRLDLLQDEYIDFSEAGDPLPQVTYLTISAMYLNIVGVLEFGGRSGAVRHEGLVEQIVASAFQTYGEYDPHLASTIHTRGHLTKQPCCCEESHKATLFRTATSVQGFSSPCSTLTSGVCHCRLMSQWRKSSACAIACQQERFGMSTKLPENFDDSGVSVEARDRLTRAFEHDLRTLETAELLAKYPEIDEEFVRHVDEFIELYRPALEALAKR